MDDRLQAAVALVRNEYPEARLFQISIPGDQEIYLARKCAWNEYKRLIGAVKDEVTANEILVQKFLVHPKLSYEQIDLEMDPGKVVILAQQIQKGLGFVTDGVTLKNV